MTQGAARTLPDLLRDGLDLVFVGINPSVFSATKGHYFARPSNRFWPCVSRSRLTLAARQGLGIETLRPQHDAALLDFGIGFTDVVKRPTAKASEVAQTEFLSGAEDLIAKLERYQPRVACFHGITGYRPFHRILVPHSEERVLALGPQPERIGGTSPFLVPSPSGANAHVKPADQTAWYDRLVQWLASSPGTADRRR